MRGKSHESLLRRFVTVVAALALGVGLVVAPGFTPPDTSILGAESAEAADLSTFQPGNIIADSVFYNSTSMTQAQIQTFFNGKVPTCQSGYTCLKSYKETTKSRAADSYCSAYKGASNETAAAIVYKVAVACGINPQVLIVMLQKEQGLVTHTWPSAFRYDKAMGYACPDTAACDTKYYGFMNQVYSAARQFQIYTDWPNSFSYKAGKSNTVKWHPNASCGTSTFTISNQATANLYNYTPYRPNQAALNAGYGVGNSCSSYGNRNFYNYFTDWFGSTQGAVPWLAKDSSHSEIYLVVGKTKHHITEYADYEEFRAVYGSVQTVAASVISGLSTGNAATALVRDPSTGEIFLLQDKQLHHFATCALIVVWGYTCGAQVDLSKEQISAVKKGAEMSEFAKRSGSSTIFKVSGKTLMQMDSAEAAKAFNGGTAPFAAVIRESVVSKYTVTKPLLGLSTFVKASGDSVVYFIDGTDTKHRLPYWDFAPEFGKSKTATATTAAKVASYKTGEELSLYVKCGSTLYFANGGKLTKVTNGDSGGFPVTTLSDLSCGSFTKSGSVSGPVFVKSGTSSELYMMFGGELRKATSAAAAKAANGGTSPTGLSLTAAAFSRFAVGTPLLQVGGLVKASGGRDVYLADGYTKKYHVPSWDVGAEFGYVAGSQVAVDASTLGAYTDYGDLSLLVTCSGVLYIANGGKLTKIASGDAAGFPVSNLTAKTCTFLTKSGSVSGPVFVKASGDKKVYMLIDGAIRHVTSQETLAALNGGTKPTIVTLRAGTIAGMTLGSPIVTPGSLVRASGDSVVYLVNGLGEKVRLPFWSLAKEFGWAETFTSVSTADMKGYTRSANDLSPFVTCGGKTYFAAGGKLSLVSSGDTGGFAVTALDTGVCSKLKLTGTTVASGKVYVKSAGSSQVWVTENGKLRKLTSGEKAGAVVLTIDQRTIDALD